jgi:hypothetical protein
MVIMAILFCIPYASLATSKTSQDAMGSRHRQADTDGNGEMQRFRDSANRLFLPGESFWHDNYKIQRFRDSALQDGTFLRELRDHDAATDTDGLWQGTTGREKVARKADKAQRRDAKRARREARRGYGEAVQLTALPTEPNTDHPELATLISDDEGSLEVSDGDMWQASRGAMLTDRRRARHPPMPSLENMASWGGASGSGSAHPDRDEADRPHEARKRRRVTEDGGGEGVGGGGGASARHHADDWGSVSREYSRSAVARLATA